MTDASSIDMAGFFERHDRRTRRLMASAFCLCLILAAVIAARILVMDDAGPPGAGFLWGMGVVYAPALTIFWWGFTEVMARRRRRTTSLEGHARAGSDDARNALRIARAGFVFTAGLMAAGVATQLLIGLLAFRIDLGSSFGVLISQAICFVVGAVTIYLGNLWPRMPTPRTPGRQASKTMKVHRHLGWFLVIVGLLVVIVGVAMPYLTSRHAPHDAPKHREAAWLA